MPLILAIEPNKHQATQIASIARDRVGAELVLADSAERALRELGDRVPDVILTPALLSPRDDAAITNRLRELGDAAMHVQTVTIPSLEAQPRKRTSSGRGLLSALRRQKAEPAEPTGCAPDMFAEQIKVYLERAIEARRAHAASAVTPPAAPEPAPANMLVPPPAVAAGPVVAEFAAPGFEELFVPVSHVAAPFLAEAVGPVADVPAPLVADVALPEVENVQVPLPEPAIRDEWPVQVEATVHQEAAVQGQTVLLEDRATRTPLSAEVTAQMQAPAVIEAPLVVEVPLAVDALVANEPPLVMEPAAAVSDPVLVTEPHAVDAAIVTAPVHAEEVLTVEQAVLTEEPVIVAAPVHVEISAPAEIGEPAPSAEPVVAVPAAIVEQVAAPIPAAVGKQGADQPDGAPAVDIGEWADAPIEIARPKSAAVKQATVKPTGKKRRSRQAPAKDDWTFFDPNETRFAALVARLDEITRPDGARQL